MNLSPAAWIALICVAGSVVLSGVVLWTTWRKRTATARRKPPEKTESPSFIRSWQKEDEQMKELAQKVKEINKKSEE